MYSDILRKMGGRKYTLAMLALLLECVLVVNGYITGLIFRDVFLGSVGLYLSSNVSQKIFADKGVEDVQVK
jgi:hypothetical protein